MRRLTRRKLIKARARWRRTARRNLRDLVKLELLEPSILTEPLDKVCGQANMYPWPRRDRNFVQCARETCEAEAMVCTLPPYGVDDEPEYQYFCPEHAPQMGFCRMCGEFWGGINSFEFLHPGLCDNCYDETQNDREEEREEFAEGDDGEEV